MAGHATVVRPRHALADHTVVFMSTVETQSAHLRQELGLTDLVLTQIMYVVGLSWVGTAGKLGTSQIPFWLAAMVLFYLPQAVVVVHLSRRFPLEGGLYQWAKLG